MDARVSPDPACGSVAIPAACPQDGGAARGVCAATGSFLLRYTPPYDWEALLAWFRHHQLPDLEEIIDGTYERVFRTAQGLAWFRVSRDAKRRALRVTVEGAPEDELPRIEAAIRRMFDVDADPKVIGQAMGQEPNLGELWARHPGVRVARAWSGYEATVTTILGQLVSVSFGRILVRELMKTTGSPALHPFTGRPIYLFPTPEQLVQADLAGVRTATTRRAAIRAVADLVLNGTLDWQKPVEHKTLRKTLLSAPGIGAWTAEYVAMRGFRDNDAFPATDYGLKQELARRPTMKVDRVRPWRAYAAALLWASYGEAKKEAQ